jgi:hypothetical protein
MARGWRPASAPAIRKENAMWAKHTIINWNWYLEFELVNDHAVRIVTHDRLKNGLATHKHPDTDLDFEIIEDKDRIARQVIIHDKVYDVFNPEHVFSYGKF